MPNRQPDASYTYILKTGGYSSQQRSSMPLQCCTASILRDKLSIALRKGAKPADLRGDESMGQTPNRVRRWMRAQPTWLPCPCPPLERWPHPESPQWLAVGTTKMSQTSSRWPQDSRLGCCQ